MASLYFLASQLSLNFNRMHLFYTKLKLNFVNNLYDICNKKVLWVSYLLNISQQDLSEDKAGSYFSRNYPVVKPLLGKFLHECVSYAVSLFSPYQNIVELPFVSLLEITQKFKFRHVEVGVNYFQTEFLSAPPVVCHFYDM